MTREEVEAILALPFGLIESTKLDAMCKHTLALHDKLDRVVTYLVAFKKEHMGQEFREADALLAEIQEKP